jgi:riboflavin biosynthesis pyrimidine reductase
MLLPGPAQVGDLDQDREGTLQALADLYAYPDPMDPGGWVRANMISTLDGSATGVEGRTGSISPPVDQTVFGMLRALSDVILVGAGTVRVEHYGPAKERIDFADRRAAAGQLPSPAMAVVTRSGKVPLDTGLFERGAPTYVITTAASDLDRLRALAGYEFVIVAGEKSVDVGDAVAALVGRGLTRILLEGGPTLLGDAFAAKRVDELCLTWAPVLVAGGGPHLAVGPSTSLSARPAHLIAAGDTLLGRWLIQR